MDPVKALKTRHLNQLADYTDNLYTHPELRNLFFELTTACNEHCFHCGSNCAVPQPDELTTEELGDPRPDQGRLRNEAHISQHHGRRTAAAP